MNSSVDASTSSLALADHQQVGGRQRHLGQQVRGHEHRPTLRGQALHERADPEDALRVEAVDRLVEQQDLRVAEQRAGQAEPLLHPEGELARRLTGDRAEADQVEDLVDPLAGDLVRCGHPAQVRPGRAVRVDPVGVEQGTDLAQRLLELVVALAVDQHAAAGGVVQTEDHPHGGRLAGPVGAQEAGDDTRVHLERQLVHRDGVAEFLGEFDGFDHDVLCGRRMGGVPFSNGGRGAPVAGVIVPPGSGAWWPFFVRLVRTASRTRPSGSVPVHPDRTLKSPLRRADRAPADQVIGPDHRISALRCSLINWLGSDRFVRKT